MNAMNTVGTVASFIYSEYKVLLDFLSVSCNTRDMTEIMRHTTHTAPHTTLEKHTGPHRLSNCRLGFISISNSPFVVVCGLVFTKIQTLYINGKLRTSEVHK